MSINKNMWILIILLFSVVAYYFIVNLLVWNIKNGVDCDSSTNQHLVYNSTSKTNIKIKHQFPLVDLSKCELKIYGLNQKQHNKLLYSGKFNKNLFLTGIDEDYLLSIHLIKKNKLYIYGSKGAPIKANSSQATITLFLKHSDKHLGSFKIDY